MWSRRLFLCAASSAGLLWAAPAGAADKPEGKKPDNRPAGRKLDPLLTDEAKKAIDSGLRYLKGGQHKDGSFGTGAYKGNVGVTSLCGLALLAGGHKPGAGLFGPTLDFALDFVLSKEHPRTRGFLHNPKASPHGAMYEHAFATLFLATAHDQVRAKERARKLQALLGRAVALTLASQNAEKGWRYQPTSRDSDLSVTAAQLCALRAARDAGYGVPKSALAGAAGYAKKCQDRRTGGFRYMRAGGTPNWGRTAAGVLALYSAGVTRGPEVQRGLAYLFKNRPDPRAKAVDVYYYHGHYYAALATWSAGGETRKKWYTQARDELLARQQRGGNWTSPICPHYATAMALMALQAPGGVLSPEF
jgi:hypothetical protein